jgi:CBS domain-containing membrane protein
MHPPKLFAPAYARHPIPGNRANQGAKARALPLPRKARGRAAAFGSIGWKMTPDTPSSRLPLFAPLLAGATSRDRMFAAIGGLIGILIVALICHHGLPAGSPYLAAPIGATAVLVFAVPASPLSQPWPALGGNVLAALVGIAAARLIPQPEVAAGVAIGAAIFLMSLLRCLHAPGGGTALVTALAAHGSPASAWTFALFPVGLNAALLVVAAVLFHRGVTGHSYPHRPAAKPADLKRVGFHAEDIDRALADMGETFDIGRDDLDLLLTHAEQHARARLKRN